jgi:hypothetical protein
VPLRVAYVGQSTFFEACVPTRDDEEQKTTFIEFRENIEPIPMRDALDRFGPDAVVVFRPEVLPPGVLGDVQAPIVGFLTEPVPRSLDGKPHPDLAKRARDLRRLDPNNLDRLVSFDPNIVPVAEQVMPVWRSLPIPVADRLYRDPAPLTSPPRLVFIGRSTPHRERYLKPVKERYDILHVAFGAGVDDLDRYLAEHEVTLNLHNEPYPSFENRVCLHLAAGHLVISEPLDPRHGLEPGRDYIEVDSPDAMIAALRDVDEHPPKAERIRVCGRQKAEAFRASTVFDGLITDLFADLEASGGRASRSAAPAALP